MKTKLSDYIELKGQPDFIKNHNTSKHNFKNNCIFDFQTEGNKNHNFEKDNSEIYQLFNNPDQKYKRTFEINLKPNKLEFENLKFKFKVNFLSTPLYWSNKIINQNIDNNFPDVFNNVFSKIKYDHKNKYYLTMKEGFNIDKNKDQSNFISMVF